MDTLHASIAKCKVALPLPELWKVLGLRGEPKRSCPSPFRANENTPAFSVFQKGNLWFWRDHGLGEDAGGDEIDLIMMAKGCERKEAIETYHAMANQEMPARAQKPYTGKSLGKIAAAYDYVDAEGSLVHQTVRFDPKSFRQRRPAKDGMRQGGRVAKLERSTGKWWLWTLDGIEPVLYRLPKLLAAAPSTPIFLCEGEKDADRLAEAQGIVTTTPPMGAGKWRKSYTEVLKGRDVIIVQDRDPEGSTEAGQKHALRVADELRNGGAMRVRIVDWNEAWPEAAADTERKIDVCEFAQATEAVVS